MKTKEELIQDYIDEVISPEDKLKFDNLLASDEEFKREVSFQMEIRTLLNRRISSNEPALRETLTEVSKEYRGKEGAKVIPWKKWLIPVTIAACFILVGRWLFMPDTQIYNLPEMRSEIVRGEENAELSRYEEAVKAFNNKDYKTSTVVLKDLVNQFPSTIQYQYYLGLSELGAKNYSEAVAVLESLTKGTSVFATDAKYYLGISYYELKSYDQAKAILNEIPENHDLFEEAQKLLEKMK